MGIITSNTTFDILLSIFLGLVAIFIYLKNNFDTWKKQGIKEMKPTFFFGNIAPTIFANLPLSEFLDNLYSIGDGEKMIGFHVFSTPYLMVRDPDLLRYIFIKDFNNFSNKILSSNKKDVIGSSNLFLLKNPPWKHIRHKLTPIFTTGKLKNMFNLMIEVCQDLDNHLESLKINDKLWTRVEISEISGKFMTDIIGTTAFGMNLNSLKDPEAEFRKYGREMFKGSFKRYYELLAIFFMPCLHAFINAKFFDEYGTEFLRHTISYVINNRIETGIKRNDLIDLLIEMKKNQENDKTDDYKFEGDALVAQAAGFFTGGFETTSTTAIFAFYELSQNIEVQNKLRNEILEGLKQTDGKITYDLVTTLPYLNMVISETLRMYPILPWIDRIPDNDYTLPGTNVTVKKGTPLILPMRAIQMDPQYFPNPDKFDPERFSEENKHNILPMTYFPFGEGPRRCIGSRLGLIQTKLILIKFISKYEMSPCDDTPYPIKLDNFNVLIHAKKEICLNLRKIEK